MHHILYPFLFVLLVAPALAQTPGDPSIEAQVDGIMEPFAGTGTPGAIVAFVHGGEIAFQRAYGMADLTHGVPLAVGTRSNIGSTSKQFTAYAIALLAREGALSLDDDVRKYIPELPDFGQTVTLRHLATHTSGYREFLNAFFLAGRRMDKGDYIGREEVVEVIQRQPQLQNAPGEEWNYNNTGYSLLALVVERVTERSFDEWMAERVFTPAGMEHALVRMHSTQVVPNSARGYGPGENGFVEMGDIGGAVGAGGIYATVGDMASWMRKLATAEGPDADLIRQMTTPYVLAGGDTTDYGLGLIIDHERGSRRIHHGGADMAHRSHFAYYPEIDAGLIVLSNNASLAPPMLNALTNVLLGEHVTPAGPADDAAYAPAFDPAHFDPVLFDVYAGRYELDVAPGFVLTFRRDGDRFYTQATGQPEIPIVPTSDSTFALTVVDARITFHRDENGRVNTLTLHQNGEHRARRLDDEGPRIDFTPYAGRYFSEELEAFYTLVVEEDQLSARHRRLDDIALVHREGDAFAGGAPLADLSFERDDEGQVTGFRAGFGRARDIWFERVQGAGHRP